MPGAILSFLAAFLLLVGPVLGQFQLKDNYVGEGFFSGFKWETFDDPTHGRVNYMLNDVFPVRDNVFVMRSDSTTKVQPGARGRDSIRIPSHKTYTDAVIVLDVAHIPEGCGTWPAFWTVTAGKWPYGGEIDVLEVGSGCQFSLHTSRLMIPKSLNCDATSGDNTGCGSTFSKPNSFGSALHSVKDGASVYFWPRNDATIPVGIKSGAKSVNPGDSWGEPEALFPTDTCNWTQHFDGHQIVFDLTFCGDWARSGFTCATGKCEDYVDNNPEIFKEAYWEVNAVRVYTV